MILVLSVTKKTNHIYLCDKFYKQYKYVQIIRLFTQWIASCQKHDAAKKQEIGTTYDLCDKSVSITLPPLFDMAKAIYAPPCRSSRK